MGNRQIKNRLFYRTCLVILFLSRINAYSQKINQPIYLQNVFYYESSSNEKKQIIIDEKSVNSCDTLIGVIKLLYDKEPIKSGTTHLQWKLSNYMSFDFESGIYCFVKIKIFNGSLFLGNKTFGFYKNNICWIEKDIQQLSNISYIIKMLKTKGFWAFYNQGKSEIPEIDNIKAQFKDSEGILDVDKLGAYLKTKPAALAKYCDFE